MENYPTPRPEEGLTQPTVRSFKLERPESSHAETVEITNAKVTKEDNPQVVTYRVEGTTQQPGDPAGIKTQVKVASFLKDFESDEPETAERIAEAMATAHTIFLRPTVRLDGKLGDSYHGVIAPNESN